MRVTIDGRDIEGTAQEVAELLSIVSGSTKPSTEKPRSEPEGASPFVSEAVAIDVLTRRPLGEAHRKMLHMLDEAGEAWTTAPKLQEALNLTTREFAGTLGALGRRVSHTDGVGTRNFLDQYWDRENGFNLYRLPSPVRAALRKSDTAK